MIRVKAVLKKSIVLIFGVALAMPGLVVQAQVFSPPKNVSNDGSAEFGQIAVDSHGNVNVVWDAFTNGDANIFFSRSTDGGVTFSMPKNVSVGIGGVIPQIAVDSTGNINLIWQRHSCGKAAAFPSTQSKYQGNIRAFPEYLANGRLK